MANEEQGEEQAQNQKLTSPRTGWDVLLVSVALGALIVLTIYTARHYGGNATNAATILGIVVPAFATIGAAAFGITVAYSAGQAKGEAAGHAKGTAEKAKAVSEARKKAADQFAPAVESARSAVDRVTSLLSEQSFSPPGRKTMILGMRPGGEDADLIAESPAGSEAPFELDPQPLEDAKSELDRLDGVVRSLQAE